MRSSPNLLRVLQPYSRLVAEAASGSCYPTTNGGVEDATNELSHGTPLHAADGASVAVVVVAEEILRRLSFRCSGCCRRRRLIFSYQLSAISFLPSFLSSLVPRSLSLFIKNDHLDKTTNRPTTTTESRSSSIQFTLPPPPPRLSSRVSQQSIRCELRACVRPVGRGKWHSHPGICDL